jgi:hypothetical protein
MYDTPRLIEDISTTLAVTSSHLELLTQGLNPVQLLAPPEPGEWSTRDVLVHLRACSDMWGKYITLILR